MTAQSPEAPRRLARLARALLGGAVAVTGRDPRAPATGLFPTEAAAAGVMADRRRREFAAGRRAARAALREIGAAPAAIPLRADRAPGWPVGLIGGISHSATCCLAAVAFRRSLTSLGLDLEPDGDLPAPLWEIILTPCERRRLEGTPPDVARRLAKLVFSAKEAVYKCQHPLTGLLLDFHDVEIDLDLERGAFSCRFRLPPRAVGAIDGRFAFAAHHVLTTAMIRRPGPPAAGPRPEGAREPSPSTILGARVAEFTDNYRI